MRLFCWLFGHKWFKTVATEHDNQDWQDQERWYRGLWHERICTRCGAQEAVFQREVYSWCPGDPSWATRIRREFQADEHYPIGGS